MKQNKKRTFSLSQSVLKKLDILNDCFFIDKSTFIRMAIYHGIKNIENKYYPYRNLGIKKLAKKKYNITLPEKTWDELKEAKEKIKYIPLDHTPDESMNIIQNFPDGELIEMFIRMEIKGFIKFISNINKDDNADDLELFEKQENVKITVSIPTLFYNRIQDTIKSTGLSEGKIYKYLVINALYNECCRTELTAIDTDADLMRYIDTLGFNRFKAITLLNTLVKANKIMFLSDNSIEY